MLSVELHTGRPAPYVELVRKPRQLPLADLAPTLITIMFAIANMIIAPQTGDLAAATYRSQLFSRAGFTLFDTAWYGGHHTLGYSVLMPPLGAFIGPRLLGALSVIAAVALFSALVRQRGAAVWFAVAFGFLMFSSRIPFELGVAVALACLLTASRGHRKATIALAICTTLASPVAALFLAIVGVVWRPVRVGAIIALAIVGVFAIAFPEGGYEPFAFSSFLPDIGLLALVALAIDRQHTNVRMGIVVYIAACIGAYILKTPVGGNADRLGELFIGPIAIMLLWPQRRRWLLVLALPMAYWAVVAPIEDLSYTVNNQATGSAYFRPLLTFLGTRGGPPFRIEIPFTSLHWEAAYVAPYYSLARGWERQLDTGENTIFYRPGLNATTYRHWLDANAVSYVALPDAPLDSSATAEAALIRGGLPYLKPVWHSAHWRVYTVSNHTPLASTPAVVTQLGTQDFTLAFAHAGASTVRIRFTPYWTATNACVSRAPGGYTVVQAPQRGSVYVSVRFSLKRIFARGPRCG